MSSTSMRFQWRPFVLSASRAAGLALAVLVCLGAASTGSSAAWAADGNRSRSHSDDVLSPDLVPAQAKPAYLAAKQHPEIFKHLFCYCGCDRGEDHSSLLDCFKSMHGVHCPYAMREAAEAESMIQSGASLIAIQQALDSDFAKVYPYASNPTPQFLAYRAQLASEGIKLAALTKRSANEQRTIASCCEH